MDTSLRRSTHVVLHRHYIVRLSYTRIRYCTDTYGFVELSANDGDDSNWRGISK